MRKISIFIICTFFYNIYSQESLVRRIDLNPQQTTASFHYMTNVSSANFRSGGQASLLTTYTITAPGTYTFVQDIGFEGRSAATNHGGNTAIFVNANNVIIDLGGKTLYQNNTTSNTNGIEIAKINIIYL